MQNSNPDKQDDNFPFRFVIAVVVVIAAYYALLDYIKKQNPLPQASTEEEYLGDIPTEFREEPTFGDDEVLAFDSIETKVVEELRKKCPKPELFTVVEVDRALSKKVDGFPAVDVLYWTVDDYGERVMRKFGALLNPDGSVKELRYHIEQPKEEE